MFSTITAMSVSDALKAIRDTEITDFTVNGQCSNCGGCCSNMLPMTTKEISEIRRYVKRFGIEPQKHFIPSRNPVYDMLCPFRDNIKHCCTIYKVRPHICRAWNCGAAARGAEFDLTPFLKNGAEKVNIRETFFCGGD